jgi:hypothetical protein
MFEWLRRAEAFVAIDLSQLPAGTGIVDLSSEPARAAAALRGFRAINFARASSEVLIELRVPPEAVLPYVPLPGSPP